VRREHFDKLVRNAAESLPAAFKPFLENVEFVVEDRPSDELLASLGFDPREDTLLGFYDGVPLTERSDISFCDVEPVTDTIYIFRVPLCEMCGDDEQLVDEIQNTIIHEVAHHFGFDEDEIDELGFA
jgi:predicted Zn-dependent protease with MMP-like domain